MTTGTIFGHKVQGARAAVGETLLHLAEQDERIVIVDAETAVATNLMGFKERFPERFITTGIAEQCAVSMAYGLSRCGLVPYLPLFAAFLTRRAYDQLFVQIGYPNANVKLMGCYAGISAASTGATHQSFNDIALMRSIPNITVIECADANALSQAMAACAHYEGPTYIRVIRADLPEYEQNILPESYRFQIGKAEILRSGTDVTLIGSGMMTVRCLKAADQLDKRGISAEVIDLGTIRPLDEETILASCEKTNAVVTAENHDITGGVGSAVAELLSEKMPTVLRRVGVHGRYGHSAQLGELLADYGLTEGNIVLAAEEALRSAKK